VFRWKKRKVNDLDSYIGCVVDQERKIRDLYPIGCEFDYLGIKMRAIKFQPYSKKLKLDNNFKIQDTETELVCDYVDNKGIIRRKIFKPSELLSLVKNHY